MLLPIFIALVLPCVAMVAVFFVYICLLWYAASQGSSGDLEDGLPVKSTPQKGLSASYLEKLPKMNGGDLVMGRDCAVCLDDIEIDEPVRLVPGCNHGFHLQCADTWLSKNSVCPICRAKLPLQPFDTHANAQINTI